MGTGAPFPGEKRGRGVMLTTHPHLVPRLRMSRSYTSSPPRRLHGVERDSFTLLYLASRVEIMSAISDGTQFMFAVTNSAAKIISQEKAINLYLLCFS
jgi:hypothetical protein